MEPLIVGSLFSGIGGMDLGLERAGFKIAWQVEIDEYASNVLAKHWPDVARFRDVRECGARNLAPVDLIAGGFPCQPHSLAGKREASEDERNLWPELYRIICELKPSWVLVENVLGLLSSERGHFFGGVLRDLAQSGYDAEWQVLPAVAFGAPHIRERVFLVAYANGSQSQSRQYECASHSGQDGNREPMAHTSSTGCKECNTATLAEQERHAAWRNLTPGTTPVESSTGGREWFHEQSSWWTIEPSVGRVAYGTTHRVDRLRGLGNAVVPQVAEYVGRCIVEAAKSIERMG